MPETVGGQGIRCIHFRAPRIQQGLKPRPVERKMYTLLCERSGLGYLRCRLEFVTSISSVCRKGRGHAVRTARGTASCARAAVSPSLQQKRFLNLSESTCRKGHQRGIE